MTDYRKILMLRSKGCTQRGIALTKVASRPTISAVYKAADQQGISWPLDSSITNAELETILFPRKSMTKVFMLNQTIPTSIGN